MVIVLVVILGVIFLALHQVRVGAFLTELVMVLMRPLGVAITWIARAIQAVVAFLRKELQDEYTSGVLVHRLIGAVLFTVLTAVFVASDIYLAKLTIGPMLGFPGSQDDKMPASLDWMAAGAMMAISLFWGLVLIDLYRGTKLLPDALTTGMRRPLLWSAWMCLLLSLVSFGVLGIWRGLEISRPVLAAAPVGTELSGAPDQSAVAPANSGEGFDKFAPVFFGASLTVLTGASLAVAFTGVILLLRYLGMLSLIVLSLPLVILLLPLRVLEQVIATINGLLSHALEIVAGVGRSVVNAIGPPIKDVRDAAHQWVHSRLRPGEPVLAAAPPVVPQAEAGTWAGQSPGQPQPDKAADTENDFRNWNWG